VAGGSCKAKLIAKLESEDFVGGED
jgi:hypothetical protein